MLITCLQGLSAYAQNIELPDIGSTADTVFSPEEERRLGKAFMQNVRQYLQVSNDPTINSYIQALGSRLVSHIDNYPLDFTFFVIQDHSINAFAGPGGYIGIHTGLILATESESELASVVAHEVAHITQRHLQRSFETARKLNLTTAAAFIAAIIIGSQNPQIGEAILASTLAGNVQTQINFTRTHEREADRIGIELLSNAGFNPRAMPAFFERLQQKNRLFANEVPEFLRTHPVTLSRISDSRNRAEQVPQQSMSNSIGYFLTRVKIKVTTADRPEELIKQFATSLKQKEYRNEYATRYGYALALLANNNYREARRTIQQLIEKDRERVDYLITQAQIDMQDRQLQRASRSLAHALELYPNNTPITIQYAQVLLETGHNTKARNILRKYILTQQSEPSVHQMLAKAEKKAGYHVAAHRSLAEFHFLEGRLHQAIDHLQMAMSQKGSNQYINAQLEARLKQFEQEIILEQQFSLPFLRAGDSK